MDVLLTPGKITYKIIGGMLPFFDSYILRKHTPFSPSSLHPFPSAGVLDFYFFAGPTPADVVAQYLQLIGRPTMPPLWALGAHQCRWGYNNIWKVREVISGYKEAKIPLDCVWLDIE